MQINTATRKAEEQVINYLIADPRLYFINAPRIKDEMFVEYADIFKAYKELVSKGEKPSIVSLSRAIGKEDAFGRLTELSMKLQLDTDFEDWLTHLEYEAKRDYCKTVVSGLMKLIATNSLDSFGQALQTSLMEMSRDSKDYKPMLDHVKDVFKHIENIQAGHRVTGWATGFVQYDNFSGGLQPSDLTVIAGTTSQGKTTAALAMAYHIATTSNVDVGVFSLEMSMLQITARLIAVDTGLSSKDILKGSVNFAELNAKLKRITNNKIHIDPSRDNRLDSIIAKMRYFVSRFQCKVFFVDYLQMVNHYVKGQTIEQNIGDICRTLKAFAKETDTSIVLLCQLNRGEGGSPAPKMSRLRGSGQIEEVADNVILVYRPDYYNINTFEDGTDALGLAEFILDKGRNIGTGRFRVEFQPQIPTFTNIVSNGQQQGTSQATTDFTDRGGYRSPLGDDGQF